MSKYLPLTPQCALTCKAIKDIKMGTKQKLFIAHLVWIACSNEMKKTKPCMWNEFYQNTKEQLLLMQTKSLMQFYVLHSRMVVACWFDSFCGRSDVFTVDTSTMRNALPVVVAAVTYVVDIKTFPFFPNCKEKRIISNTSSSSSYLEKGKNTRATINISDIKTEVSRKLLFTISLFNLLRGRQSTICCD